MVGPPKVGDASAFRTRLGRSVGRGRGPIGTGENEHVSVYVIYTTAAAGPIMAPWLESALDRTSTDVFAGADCRQRSAFWNSNSFAASEVKLYFSVARPNGLAGSMLNSVLERGGLRLCEGP